MWNLSYLPETKCRMCGQTNLHTDIGAPNTFCSSIYRIHITSSLEQSFTKSKLTIFLLMQSIKSKMTLLLLKDESWNEVKDVLLPPSFSWNDIIWHHN